jgi:20S proteasome alpha/beta subunit
MSVVVGVRHTKGVLLAGDLQWSGDNSHRMGVQPKVHSLLDTLALGYVGSGRFGQILQYHLSDSLEDPFLPREGRDEEYWTVKAFIPYLREQTELHGHLHIHHNVEEFGPSAFLLAVRGKLFTIEADFSVNEHRLPYEAVGSGEDNAIGVLHAMLGEDPEMELPTRAKAERAARRAVEAAMAFNNYVGGAVTFVETSLWTQEEIETAKRILGR